MFNRLLVLLCACLLWCSTASANTPTHYQVGVATRVITPCTQAMREFVPTPADPQYVSCHPDAIYMKDGDVLYTSGGTQNVINQRDIDRDRGRKYYELETRALVIEDAQGKRVAWVELDVVLLGIDFTNDVRAAILSRSTRTPVMQADDIHIVVSHTHSGPAIVQRMLNGVAETPNPDYVAAVKERVISAVLEAENTMQPANLAIKHGLFSSGRYRRPDGRYPQVNDYAPRMDVLSATNATGELLAVASFLPCHATSMDGSVVSPDYPGSVRAALEETLPNKAPGFKAIFFQGFGGDVELRQKDRGTYIGAITTQIAGLVSSSSSAGTPITGSITTQTVTKPLALDASTSSTGPFVLNETVHEATFGTGTNTAWSFVFSNNEIVSEYADNVRSNHPNPERVTLAGYADNVTIYLPTQRMAYFDRYDLQQAEFGYEGCRVFTTWGLALPAWHDNDFYTNQGNFSDDFTDNERNKLLWVQNVPFKVHGQYLDDPQVTVAEANQQLTITPRSGSTRYSYGGYSSVHTYNFHDKAAAVQVVVPGASGSSAEFGFMVYRNENNYYRFVIQNNLLRADYRENGDETVLTNLGGFNPTVHQYLRIRNDQSLILWECSGDGVTWQTLASRATSFDVNAMRISLFAGTYFSQTNPPSFTVDNFVFGPVASTSASRSASLAKGVVPTAVTAAVVPNPIGQTGHLVIESPGDARAVVTLYNTTGQQVQVIYDGQMHTGSNTVPFNTATLQAGLYYCQITSTAGRKTVAVSVVK